MKVKVILLVFGALGTRAPLLPKRLKDIGIGPRITELKKTVIFILTPKSARDLRSLVDTKSQVKYQ